MSRNLISWLVYLGKVLVAELERGVEVLAEEVWVAGAVGLSGEGVHHHQVTLVTWTLFTHHTPHGWNSPCLIFNFT